MCGEAAPEDHHRVWACRGLDRSAAALKNSEHLESRDLAEKDILPVFWTRGLPPKEWFEVEPPQASAEEIFFEIEPRNLETEPLQLDTAEWVGCKPFSDGSGGEFSQSDRWRRCAWAVALIKKEGDVWKLKAAWGKPLEGPVQSAPRAELAALLAFATGTEGRAELGVDCAYVVDGFANMTHFSKADGPNMDLWGGLGRRLAERRGELKVYKVKGVHKGNEQDRNAVIEGKKPDG